jgi:hypothetical protein
MTSLDLADYLQVAPVTVCLWATGKSIPQKNNAIAIDETIREVTLKRTHGRKK